MFDPFFSCLTFVITPRDASTRGLVTGPAVRGAFGYRLRALSCVTGTTECAGCGLAAWCPYGRVFETPNLGTAARLRGTDKAPHPFILKMPRAVDGHLLIHMTIVGDGLRDLPMIVHALRTLGDGFLARTGGDKSVNVRFSIDQVLLRTSAWTDEPLYAGAPWPADRPPSIRLSDLAAALAGRSMNRARLLFLSPTLIVSGGEPIRRGLTFDAFLERLLHRLDVLSSCFCGSSLDDDERERVRVLGGQVSVVHDDLRWEKASRTSTRSATRDSQLPLDGLVGSWELSGPMTELMPYLLAGQAASVGKNTSSGCGDYVVERAWTEEEGISGGGLK